MILKMRFLSIAWTIFFSTLWLYFLKLSLNSLAKRKYSANYQTFLHILKDTHYGLASSEDRWEDKASKERRINVVENEKEHIVFLVNGRNRLKVVDPKDLVKINIDSVIVGSRKVHIKQIDDQVQVLYNLR